jgi:hypothetical protein
VVPDLGAPTIKITGSFGAVKLLMRFISSLYKALFKFCMTMSEVNSIKIN